MLLAIKDVTKAFDGPTGPVPVLLGVTLSLTVGERVALTGESGSGKSTLLHLAAGLDVPDAGTIEIVGQPINGLDDKARAHLRRRTVGMVFQQFNLIPSLSVADNLSFHARLADRLDPAWTDHLVKSLGLDQHLGHYPEQLSGGQQQRVAIGRTLAARPKLILADEPTGNLDEGSRDAVIDLMLELVDQAGSGLLVVTHSAIVANRMDRQLHLSGGRLQ